MQSRLETRNDNHARSEQELFTTLLSQIYDLELDPAKIAELINNRDSLTIADLNRLLKNPPKFL